MAGSSENEGYPSFVHGLTESDIHRHHLPDDIGTRWKDLARELEFKETCITNIESDKVSNKECCIALLVKWMEREGEEGATCETLATALANIGLQNLADRLIGPSKRRIAIPIEVEKTIKLDDAHQTQIMLARDSTGKKKFLVWESEQNEFETLFEELDNSVNATIQISLNTPEETKIMKTSEVKDLNISEKLKSLKEKLSDVTSSLEKGELREESFPLPDRLDLIYRHSRTLQELYTQVTGMTGEAYKCDELVRRNFYDFTYHNLRTAHDVLSARAAELQSAEETLKEKEKETLKNLLSYQRGREKQVEQLEKLWIGLFSPIKRAQSEHVLTKEITTPKIVRTKSESSLTKGKTRGKYGFALIKRKSEGNEAVLVSYSEAQEK